MSLNGHHHIVQRYIPHHCLLSIPTKLILCRGITRSFHAAFTESELCRHALLESFPRAREIQAGIELVKWSDTLAKVAARYYHLRPGHPRSIETLSLGRSFVVPAWARYYPVAKWGQHLQFEESTAPFHYPDTLWTYDKGLLIYPCTKSQRYMLYDLESEEVRGEIAWQPEGKIMRRMSLKDNVLIVEWCEQDPYHQLNENEVVYRHFATAYDLVQNIRTQRWSTVFRLIPPKILFWHC